MENRHLARGHSQKVTQPHGFPRQASAKRAPNRSGRPILLAIVCRVGDGEAMAQAEGEVRGEIEFEAMVIVMVMLRLGLRLGRRSRHSARAPQRTQESLADKNIGRF